MAEVLPNPWTDPGAFDRFVIGGVEFTGKVELDTNELLKKKADHRRGRGRNGARTVATGWDLVEFSATLSAHDDATLTQLQAVLRRVGRGSVATQDTTALSVSHPYLSAVSISQVTLASAGFVPVQAGGMLGLRLKLKEFRAPTQAQTPGARAPDPEPQQVEDGSAFRGSHRGQETLVSSRRSLQPQPLAPRAPRAPSSDP